MHHYFLLQNGRFLGNADLERQKFSELKLNGPQVKNGTENFFLAGGTNLLKVLLLFSRGSNLM